MTKIIGGRTMPSTVMAAAFMAVLMASCGGRVSAQPPACGQKLIGCAAYINGNDMPPSSCCDPLKETVTNEMNCLCNIFNSPDLLKGLGIDREKALNLPSRCGFASDTNACRISAGGPSASLTPPATPGGNDNGSAVSHGVTYVGMVLILLLWSVIA